MNEPNWYWVYFTYLDEASAKSESALKAGYTKVVLKSEVDNVIAEKDKMIADLKDSVREALESARKLLNAKTEQVMDEVFQKCLIYGEGFVPVKHAASLAAEIVNLRRALWLARAERAEARKNYWYVRSIHEGDKDLWSIDGSAVKYIGCIKRTNYDWLLTWSEVESRCRAKAKEHK